VVTWQDPPGLVRPTEPPRETVAALRGCIPWLKREGLFDAVVAKVSPATAAMLNHPPLPTRWMDSTVLHEICVAIVELRGERGERALREMALEVTRRSLGVIVRPMLSLYLRLSGSTPGSLFPQMPSITSLVIKGVAFHWTPDGANAGALVIAYANPVEPVAFMVWHGILSFAFEVSSTKGAIQREVAPDHSSARYLASWSSS